MRTVAGWHSPVGDKTDPREYYEEDGKRNSKVD